MTNGIYYNSTAGTLNFLVNNQPSIQINSGGTTVISGTTVFNGTISATTIVSPSLDVTITGGTYSQSSGTLNLRNSTGGTVPVSGYFNYITGGTYSAGTITLGTNTGGTTSINDLVGRAGLLGGVNFLSRWSTQYDLQDSQIYDDGSLVGINTISPAYSEPISFQTSYRGMTLDGMYMIETGNDSIAFATGHDYSPWGGTQEIAIGSRGPLINSTGSGNIALGDKSLQSNTTGINNIAIGGTQTLFNNLTGSSNIALGINSMTQNTIGDSNISIGEDSLRNNISGGRNIIIGVGAGYSNNTRNGNVYIGYNAGYNNDGSYNIFIGYNVGYGDTSSGNRLNIGDTIYGDISSKLIGINQTNPNATLDVSGTTIISGGLTASTISATTYQNLPISGVTNGTGISTSKTNGLVTISNTQVQGITGKTDGNGISSSISNNVITITNTGVTGITTTNGISGSSTTGGITLINTQVQGITGKTDGSGISSSISNNVITITNTDLGSSQNIFKNIQINGNPQFSAGSNNSNLNFSGINVTITSAATNTLVFSAGTGGSSTTFNGGTVSGPTIFTGGVTANTLNVTGVTTSLTFLSSQSVGDEGGQIDLAKSQTNTTLSGSTISIDIYQNKLRFFESGGNNRGAYIDLSKASTGVTSNIIVGLGTVYTTSNNLNFI